MTIPHRTGLDRIPTRWERLIGIVSSGVIALLGLLVLIGLGYASYRDKKFGSAAAWASAVGCLLLAIGAWFFYRTTFTKPAESSPGSRLALAWAATFAGAATVVGALFGRGSATGVVRPGLFFAIALGWLLAEIRSARARGIRHSK